VNRTTSDVLRDGRVDEREPRGIHRGRVSDTESGVQVRVWVGDRKRAPKLAGVLNKASRESRVTPNNLFSTRKVLLQLHEEVTHFCALSNVPDGNTSVSRFSSFVSQNASLVSSAFS
jgi:hypothetical protein